MAIQHDSRRSRLLRGPGRFRVPNASLSRVISSVRLSATVMLIALWGALPGSASAQPARVDLSPAAAARTVSADVQEPPSPEADGPGGDEERALAASITGLVRSGDETRAQTRDRGAVGLMWSALRPWKGLNLLLHDVRYWYVGRGIDAAIAADGSVAFHDKDGVVAAPLPLIDRFGAGGRAIRDSDNGGSPLAGGRIRGLKLAPGFAIADPARALRRHATHEDPHALERADFLERTRTLRDWLQARARDRDEPRATRELLSELARIWSPEASLSAAQRQTQTFAIWDACDEDEQGAHGRSAIVGFLRGQARTRGVCPFDPATLARLNAARRSREALVPCDAAASASRP